MRIKGKLTAWNDDKGSGVASGPEGALYFTSDTHRGIVPPAARANNNTITDDHLPRIHLASQQVVASNSISTVMAINVHFSDVKKLAARTIASARSGKTRVTDASPRFSHQSAMIIREGNRHRYRNRPDEGNSLRRTSMSATAIAIE